MTEGSEMTIGDWINTPSGSGDIPELHLSKDSIRPADFVITINLDPADVGKTTVHSIKERVPDIAPNFKLEESNSSTIHKFFCDWAKLISSTEKIKGALFFGDFAMIYNQVLNLVKVGTPHLHNGNWVLRKEFGEYGTLQFHNTQYGRRQKSLKRKSLTVRLSCPMDTEDPNADLVTCALKLKTLLKGLPVKVHLSIVHDFFFIHLHWHCNVQNVFLKMVGTVVLPEIKNTLQNIIQVPPDDSEKTVGRGQTSVYQHLEPCCEFMFAPVTDNLETDDEK